MGNDKEEAGEVRQASAVSSHESRWLVGSGLRTWLRWPPSLN